MGVLRSHTLQPIRSLVLLIEIAAQTRVQEFSDERRGRGPSSESEGDDPVPARAAQLSHCRISQDTFG